MASYELYAPYCVGEISNGPVRDFVLEDPDVRRSISDWIIRNQLREVPELQDLEKDKLRRVVAYYIKHYGPEHHRISPSEAESISIEEDARGLVRF